MLFRTILIGAALLAAPIVHAQASEAGRTDLYREAAEAMLPALAGADQPGPLGRLMRLQVATGRYKEAEATLIRLSALLRPDQPRRADALAPWRIYVRARRYEAEGMTREAGLARAFDELFAQLPDREMAAILPYYGVDLKQLRESETRAAAECAGMTLMVCPKGYEAISARQSVETWSYLIPASERLIRADAERRFIIDDRILAPTPDGARIAVMLVRPRGTSPAKLTTLMSFTIYNREDWSFADAVQMAANGYVGAVAYTRGKGRGRGQPDPYLHDGADAATVIDWLAAQGWSDGRVGMFSGSYNAFTQWAALKNRPRALKAIATNATNAPGIDTPMQGGVFLNFMYPWPIYTSSGNALDSATYDDRARWAKLNRDWYVGGRPYRELERIDGRANPVFASWLDHPDYDAFWQRMIPQGREFADIDIPVYVQTGYFDGGMVGALHYLREHLRYRPDADHRMIVGPYHHTAQQSGVLASVNGYEIDRSAMIDLAAIRMQWFDHVFRGAPLPAMLRERINYQVMGADRWRHVPTLDAMATERLRLHLGGSATDGRYPLGEAVVAGAGPELRVDLADRSDVDFEAPERELDTRGALLFATAPLTAPIEVSGGFTARFEIVTNKRDLDLSVIFFEQRADGSYFRLASFLGRASYMADRRKRQLLRPGVPQRLAFESQTITARRLPAGSRIVALIGVPKTADTQINYGTGGDVASESIADAGDPMTIRWLAGSYLELGVRRAPFAD